LIPGVKVYVGMILGEHSRDNDLEVNPIKEKEADQYPRRRQG
jgi:GTP-binding protein